MENQQSHDQRQDQGSEAARQSQSHAPVPEHRQFSRPHIAPVALNSQNARDRKRLRAVSLVVRQLSKRHRAVFTDGAAPSKLSKQAPFAFEFPNDRDTAKSNENQAGNS
jgi:hypothetical protein